MTKPELNWTLKSIAFVHCSYFHFLLKIKIKNKSAIRPYVFHLSPKITT